MRYAALLLIALGVAGCASTSPSTQPSGGGVTAIYSPPTRLGGKGSMIFLPAPLLPTVRADRPLEAPDREAKPPTADWLVGVWLKGPLRDASRVACNSGTVTEYRADGNVLTFEGRARWRLEDDKLTETLMEIFETADPKDMPKIGSSFTDQVKRIGPNEGAVLVAGQWLHMLRCRPADIN